jgi:hypothetical protein
MTGMIQILLSADGTRFLWVRSLPIWALHGMGILQTTFVVAVEADEVIKAIGLDNI